MNLPLITSLTAIFFTQLIKYPIAMFFNRKGAKIDLVMSTGGMPSSHSAAVSSLITALIFEYGFSSPYVAIATLFGVIVMFDSMGVRRQSGEQGIVLDILARNYLAEMTTIDETDSEISTAAPNSNANPLTSDYNYDDYEHMIIKKYLGHKPTEVIVGLMTGGFVAFIMRILYQELLAL